MRRRAGRWGLRLMGWRTVGELPPHRRFVAIGAPHTSNWDFVIAMFAIRALDMRVAFLAKHTLFRGPLGWLMRRLGGIAVDRSRPEGVVEAAVAAFAERDDLIIGITPEGTRGAVSHWRSGFYRIALAAGVPVVPVALDAGRRRLRVGPEIDLSGDVAADMDHLRAYYRGVRGFKPDRVGPVRLREEG